MSISIEMARKVQEACKQRARELRSPVSIAIVDAGGHLVLFERMMAPYGFATGDISIAKAHTAVMFNQSTDDVAQWGAAIPGFASSLASMTNGQFIMAAGGWPLRVNGVTIGGVGVSGGNAPGRDDEIARAGLGALEASAPPMRGTPANVPQPQPVYNNPAEPAAPYSQPLYSQAAYNTQDKGNSGEPVSGSSTRDRDNSSIYNQSNQKPADLSSSTTREQDSYQSFRYNSATHQRWTIQETKHESELQYCC
ncbi:GlcG/HbpS family heme-binding protein [Dictyobacter kobayashii]|uniref:Heme-binding protein n=1 Tax=Dictyobacter kobayashii TaxID=2014872 RepID=A0A402AGT5_9CHLR|nr:heme-binding protein [Dictyobacter kobayashii]GCE18264.1 hypothetical protein KDK_20640 [Dictyobacter kobayashii]